MRALLAALVVAPLVAAAANPLPRTVKAALDRAGVPAAAVSIVVEPCE